MSIHTHKHLCNIIGHNISLIFCLCIKHIKPYRIISICKIKIDKIIYPFFGYIFEDMFTQISMRIDQTKSVSQRNILLCHSEQCSRFTSTSLSDYIKVSKSINRSDPYLFFNSSIRIIAQQNTFRRYIIWSWYYFKILSSQARITIKFRVWKMNKRRKFFNI